VNILILSKADSRRPVAESERRLPQISTTAWEHPGRQLGVEPGPSKIRQLAAVRQTLPDLETVYKDFGVLTGAYPQSLVQTKYGEFYGSATSGGTLGGGVIFRLRMLRAGNAFL
jgi:hypothetical protein